MKGIDTQVYGVARQAELTSSTISRIEESFRKFRDEKGKLPRKRPLPKVEVLYGLTKACAKLLEDIRDLIYIQVDETVITNAEGGERPEKMELSADKLELLKTQMEIAQTDIQLYTANLEVQITIFYGELSDQ